MLFAVGAVSCASAHVRQDVAPACYACDELDAGGPGAGAPRGTAEARSLDEPQPLAAEPQPLAAEPVSDRWETRRIGARSEETATRRPPRRRRVDVELRRAPFDDVARLLSDAGRFDIVLDAPSAHEVTVSLKDVEPFEALELIAEAQGLRVRYERGVVVVSN